MNVSLTPELEELINQKVKSGFYGSASEVVRESLRRMFAEEQQKSKRVITEEQRRQMDDLRREVLKGVEQIRNGESITYNSPEELSEDIIKRGMEKLARRRKDTSEV